jgi:hypothetical protein
VVLLGSFGFSSGTEFVSEFFLEEVEVVLQSELLLLRSLDDTDATCCLVSLEEGLLLLFVNGW